MRFIIKNLIAVLACGLFAAAQIAVGSGPASFSGLGAVGPNGSISTPVIVTGPSCPLSGTETSPFSQTFTASNGTAPFSFTQASGSLTGSGLTLASNGTLSGTPPVGASSTSPYTIGVVATDARGVTSSPYSCTINIAAIPAGPVSITNSSPLPSGQLTVLYSTALTGTGGTPPYTYSQCSGSLPNGITLTSGVLSGTPTVQSTFTFGLQATDSASTSGSCQSYQITINAAPSCSTSPGPPTYPCSRTDLANAWPPASVPNLGNLTGINTIVADPDFSNRIVRVTDTTIGRGGSAHPTSFVNNSAGSAELNQFNSDSTLFFFQDEGGFSYVSAFNVTGLVNTSGTAVTWASGGQNFANVGSATKIIINGTTYTIQSVNSNTSITLTTSAGTQTGVVYEVDTFQTYKIYPATFTGSNNYFNFGVPAFFKRGSRTILHSAVGATIKDYDFTDWLTGAQTTVPTATTTVDFTSATGAAHNALPSGFTPLATYVGGSTNSDIVVMGYSSTSGQGSSGSVYIVTHDPTKGFCSWRTDTGAIACDNPGYSGGTGLTCSGNTCSGTINIADRFTIHTVKSGASDNWIKVTGTTCLSSCQASFPTQYFWEIGTNIVGFEAQGGKIGGHSVIGTSTFINQPGTNHIFQFASRPIGNNTTPSLVIPLSLFPTFPSVGVGSADSHESWFNVDGSDTHEFIWSSLNFASGSVANNFGSVGIPSNFTQLRDFAFNKRNNHICAADRLKGIACSHDGGATWAAANGNLPTASTGNILGWTITWDDFDQQWIAGLCGGTTTCDDLGSGTHVSIWRSSGASEGASWTQIPGITSSTTIPAFTGPVTAPNGNLIVAEQDGSSGSAAYYSTDGGATTHAASFPANGTCTAPGGSFSLYTDPITATVWAGTEQCGAYMSSDNGHTFSACSPPEQSFPGGIRDGNVDSIISDAAGDIFMATQGGVWKAAAGQASCPYTWTNVFANENTSEGRRLYRDSKGNIYYGHRQDSGACNPPTNGGTCPLYVSTNNGATWSSFSTGLTAQYEPWQMIQNPFDGMLYVYLQKPSNPNVNSGTLWKTILDNGGLAPYGWQNELLGTVPATGVTSRFSHTFSSAISQIFQTQTAIAVESSDGRYAIMNTDDEGTFGSETGGALCMLGVDCRGDVVIVEQK